MRRAAQACWQSWRTHGCTARASMQLPSKGLRLPYQMTSRRAALSQSTSTCELAIRCRDVCAAEIARQVHESFGKYCCSDMVTTIGRADAMPTGRLHAPKNLAWRGNTASSLLSPLPTCHLKSPELIKWTGPRSASLYASLIANRLRNSLQGAPRGR